MRAYCAASVHVTQIDPARFLLSMQGQRESLVTPREVASLLLGCTGSRTLEEHANAYSKGVHSAPEWCRVTAVKVLDSFVASTCGRGTRSPDLSIVALNCLLYLAERGFLLPTDVTREAGSAVDRPRLGDEFVRTLGVITCDRPATLARCLVSYARNVERHGRTSEFIVTDDSRSAESRSRCRKVCAESKYHGVTIRYAGHEEKRAFLLELIAMGIPSAVGEYALFGTDSGWPTYGANRNALLMQTTDEKVISVDDDTVCRLGTAGPVRDQIRFSPASNNGTYRLFPDHASGLSVVSEQDADFFGMHERFLGRDLRSIHVGEMDADQLAAESSGILAFLHTPEARVLCTFNGLVGDSGCTDATFLLSLPADQVRDGWQLQLSGRTICRSTQSPIIYRAGPCMTMSIGLDNRSELPPFFPHFRSEDYAFGELLRLCTRSGFFCDIPYLAEHLPPGESRSWSLNPKRSKGTYLPPYQLLVLSYLGLSSCFRGSYSLSYGLSFVGSYLQYLAGLPIQEYRDVLIERYWARTSKDMNAWSELLKRNPDAPSHWRAMVQHTLEDIEEKCKYGVTLAPERLVEQVGRERAEEITRQLVWKYGELLSFWPKIRDASRGLREKGVQLAQLV